MITIIALIFAVFFLFVLFKYQHFQTDIANIVVVSILVVLIASLSYLYFKVGADISTFDGLSSFMHVYFAWISNIFSHTGELVGYVVNQNMSAIGNVTAAP